MSHDLTALAQAVYQKRPQLDRIIQEFGSSTLSAYTEKFPEYNVSEYFTKPRSSFLETVREIATPLLGDQKTTALTSLLEKNPVVNTGDHHGPILSPILISGNLIYGLQNTLSDEESVIPVFAFGNVPLNNATYPRGVLCTELDGEKPATISLYSDKQKHMMVAVAPAFSAERKELAFSKLQSLKGSEVFSDEKAECIEHALESVFFHEDVLSRDLLSDQVTVMNERLWGQFFDFGQKSTLAYLQIESIVNAHLIRLLEEGEVSFVSLLLNSSWRERAYTIFDGIPGAWDLENGKGTSFFWGVDHKGRGVSLHEEDGYLCGGDLKIALEKGALTEAIRERQLVPSLFTSFSVVAFTAGLKCYGGFMQTDYLASMQKGWVTLLTEQEREEEAQAIASVPASNWCIGPAAFVVERGGQSTGCGGLDLLASPVTKEQMQTLGSHTLKDLMMPGFPFMYKTVYTEDADPELKAITADSVFRELLSDLYLSR